MLPQVLAALPLRPGAEALPALALAARQVSDRVAGDRVAAKDAKAFAARQVQQTDCWWSPTAWPLVHVLVPYCCCSVYKRGFHRQRS